MFTVKINVIQFQLRHVVSVEKETLFFDLIILKKYLYQPSQMLSAGL